MTPGQLPDSFFPEFLIANQNADGGWGYHAASPSAVEATAWALTALTSPRQTPAGASACLRARDWLLRAQLDDGSWPAFPGHPQGCWVTSIAAHALLVQGGSQSAVARGVHWLLNAWPAEGGVWWRLHATLFPSRLARQDNSLRGWNWTPGTASWVEPTTHALMLLYSAPSQMLPALAAKRRRLAERMLFDRMCPNGGWNSGNPHVYGVAGIPRVGPTAWALLALREHAEREEVQSSLRWLARAYADIHGAASLALAHRCLTVHGRPVPALAPALNKMYSHNRFFGNVVTFAFVTAALHAVVSDAPAGISEKSPR